MRTQQLGPELVNPETAPFPLISASRLRSRRTDSPTAQFLACRRSGPLTPFFGAPAFHSRHFDLLRRSVTVMRTLLTFLLLAALLFTVGASALAADTPETDAAKSSQGAPLVRALAAKGILTAQEAPTQ